MGNINAMEYQKVLVKNYYFLILEMTMTEGFPK
jgi:hypothetical protein